ncbi:hypothetical protein PENTCL1PPCAC_23773, partial [Pristionchus entomophagus]
GIHRVASSDLSTFQEDYRFVSDYHVFNVFFSDENVDYLLKLGDQFDIDWVVSQCEQFLVTSTKFTVASKLVFASRFRLFVLQVHCLDQLKTAQDVKELKVFSSITISQSYFSELERVQELLGRNQGCTVREDDQSLIDSDLFDSSLNPALCILFIHCTSISNENFLLLFLIQRMINDSL